ncbi:hypothetical protein CDL12_05646 [Handroanthus impetiginosus]|uniref:Uncharacterized protein n=1 Tax=Handroanthus impetiginosus TaxID=429701 RepID=A0A2G9HWE1_9LAMI|nr:hypothetical protein CDL12_05646 [Handroanthus impetiginosus]
MDRTRIPPQILPVPSFNHSKPAPFRDAASRLIVTSRIHNIPRSARCVYEMKTLDPDKSWELLLKTAVNDNNDINKCPQELEYIGTEIVAKCNGLPLAITVMGGLLQEKRQTKSGWEEVLKGINSHLGTGENNNVQAILELSYHDLPSHLKSCFLCLAFFREDATMHANTLIKVWIAEGLVPQEDGQVTMEDVAGGYLDDRVDQQKHGSGNRHLRSLFFRGDKYHFCNDAPDLNSFRLLGVLEMEGLGLTEFPPRIGALPGLKYLNLKNNEISKLPKSLGCLKNLQVLDMGENGEVYVPNVIWKMDSLRHINIDWPASEVPLKLNTLRNLQTLTNIGMHILILEHITQITSLRKLGVHLTAGSDVSMLCTSLAMLENLVCLKLYCRGHYDNTPFMDGLFHLKGLTSLKLQGPTSKFTSVNNFPPNLSYLTLKETRLEEDLIRVLEKLPNLVCLKLDMDAYIGHELVISHEGFPSLKALYLRSINTLINIKVENGGMPKLKRLEIRKCINLVKISKEFCNLQELKIVTAAWKASHFRFHNSRIMSKIPFVQIVVNEKDWPNAE